MPSLDEMVATPKNRQRLSLNEMATTPKNANKFTPDKLFSGETDINDVPEIRQLELDEDTKARMKTGLVIANQIGADPNDVIPTLDQLGKMYFEKPSNPQANWQKVQDIHKNTQETIASDVEYPFYEHILSTLLRPGVAAVGFLHPSLRTKMLEYYGLEDWGEEIEKLSWYQKLPEATGYVAERYIEYQFLKPIFAVTGLEKATTLLGEKLAATLGTKELMRLGGKELLLRPKGWEAFRQAMIRSIATNLPKTTAFMSLWGATEGAKTGELKEVGYGALSGAKWGIGLSVLAPTALIGGRAVMDIPFVEKSLIQLQTKFPRMADWLAGEPEKEFVDASIRTIKEEAVKRGVEVPVDFDITDLPKTGQSFVKAVARRLTNIASEAEIRKAQAYTYTTPSGKAKPTEGVKPTERPTDLLGRPILEGGAAGKQGEFLTKEEYRLPKPDIEGQMKLTPPAGSTAEAIVEKVEGEVKPPEGDLHAEVIAIRDEEELPEITPTIAKGEIIGLPKGYTVKDRGETYIDAYGIIKPVKQSQKYAVISDGGIDVRAYGATPKDAVVYYQKSVAINEAEKARPKQPEELTEEERIEQNIQEIRHPQTGEMVNIRNSDIQRIAELELGELGYAETGRSNVSESSYFEGDKGRVRIASHGIARKESQSDIFIGIGDKGLLDADIIIPQNATVQEIKNAVRKAVGIKPPPPYAPQEVEGELPGYIEREPVIITDKERTSLIKGITKEIQEHPIYQNELQGIKGEETKFAIGRYYVLPQYKGEVQKAIEDYPALKFHITYDPTKGKHWDEALMELGQGGETIDYFLDRLGQTLKGGKKAGELSTVAFEKAKQSGDLSLELMSNKLDWLKQGLSPEEINDNVKRWATGYGISEEDIAGEFILEPAQQLKLAPSEAEEADILRQTKKLRAQIHILAAEKGLGKKTLSDIKLKYGGQRKLVGKRKSVGLQDLEKIYDAVKKARPKLVERHKVVSRKTEKQIATLKGNLTVKGQMTDEAWQNILQKETGGIEPKYVNFKQFITQEQARAVIKRMHSVATELRITKTYEQAIKDNPRIKKLTDEINTKIQDEKSKGIKDPTSFRSMRYYSEQLGLKADIPLREIYDVITDLNLEGKKTVIAEMASLEATVGKETYRKIAKDETATRRIVDYINSESTLENRPVKPKDITPDEIKIAETIKKILQTRQIHARIGKFFRWYDMNMPTTGEEALKIVPDYELRSKEYKKAVEIYDTKGLEELIEYLKTATFGTIKSGYDPIEQFLHPIQPFEIPIKAVATGPIQARESIEYVAQEKHPFKRLANYLRRMENLVNLKPYLDVYIEKLNDNAGKFDDWNRVKSNIELWATEIKGQYVEKSILAQMWNRVYAQVARAKLINNLGIGTWNLLEDTMLSSQKDVAFRALYRKLTPAERVYLETYVHQQRALTEEFYMTGEKPLPVIGKLLAPLNALAERISLTAHSDVASRYMSFAGKLQQIYEAFETAKTFQKALSTIDFSQFTNYEQKKALGINARDGLESMAMYLARLYSDNIHAIYTRSGRSPAEMGGGGRSIGNLMNYPRMWTERFLMAGQKLIDPKTDFETRWQSARTVVMMTIGATILGHYIIGGITGVYRNPYNPLNIINWQAGGLYYGAIHQISQLLVDTSEAINPETPESIRKRIYNKLTIAIPQVNSLLLPFYDQTIRALEKGTEIKYIDRYALRKIREMLDEDYEMRPDAYEFNKEGWINAAQYIIYGRAADYEIEEE